jgi:hypothetical protein
MSNATLKQGERPTLGFTFEGKNYQWESQYIMGYELRKRLNLTAGDELYLEIAEPWNDEPVPDDKEIDLARPGIEQFFVKKKLKYTINGVEFESSKQYIQGRRIRQQGNIPNDDLIYLRRKSPWEDELILDNDWVDLASPGIEHFYSQKHPVKVTLIVNGKPKEWNKMTIDFKDVIVLAFGEYNPSPTMVYTVGYEDGPKQNPEGSMTKEESLFVKNKMIFHATATNKS